MRDSLKGAVSHVLEQAAEVIGLETGSIMLWGEVKVPKCLRTELEEVQEQE